MSVYKTVLAILSNKKIMEYDESQYMKDGKRDWQMDVFMAPCSHDDDFLCIHRKRFFARRIADYLDK